MRGLVGSCVCVILLASCMGPYGGGFGMLAQANRKANLARSMSGQPYATPQQIAKQEFYYYPAAEVYFNAKDKTYMFFKNGSWMYDMKPPESIVSLNLYVKISDEANQPWVRHEHFKTEYPKDHFKNQPKE